ncbi:MAG: lysophospholipid acyltransferase (LPLAT)-like uncharacterized protein [Arenicella sp.]
MKSTLKFIVVPYLFKSLIVLVTATCRVRWHNRQALDELNQVDRALVMSMWHSCSTTATWVLRNTAITVMVSNSRDGEYVSRLANLFGIQTLRGSSSSGSAKAIRSALKVLAKNRTLGVTPDGPRGPKFKMQNGALWFAASSKAPILPIHIESTRQWVLRSWDGHCLPKPFSTIHVGVGKPTWVDKSELVADANAVALRIEHAMMDNVNVVRAACGQQ